MRRFIPAGAGNTLSSAIRNRLRTVHPRGCGEPFLWCILTTALTGSSPRVRGTLYIDEYFWIQRWFIPAGAGNTNRP